MADAEMDLLMEDRGLECREATYSTVTGNVPLVRPGEPAEMLSIVVYFRKESDPRWLSTFVAPGLGFLGLLLIVVMAIWNFPLLAGSDALGVTLLPILLLVALVGGIVYGAHLRSNKPEIFAGLSDDLEKFEEQQDRADLPS